MSPAQHGGLTQRRVRATIGRLGGYWRPLAGVVRLLEELGELGELLACAEPNLAELAAELADLWIITTAVADQFLADVAEPGSAASSRCSYESLVAAAAHIARVVNYYDGPKAPRSIESLPTVASAVASFHVLLDHYARAHEVELAAAVGEKLDEVATRDAGRFASGGEDPSTAPCLDAVRSIVLPGHGWDLFSARLWGYPTHCPADVGVAACAILPTLTVFAKAAPREPLDAYVIAVPDLVPASGCSLEWAERLLRALSNHDPRPPAEPSFRDNTLRALFTFAGLTTSVELLPVPRASQISGPTRVETFMILRL